MTERFILDDHCFACGVKNPFGLKLKVEPHPDGAVTKAVCTFTLAEPYQGYGGIVHGGVLATILDEVMVYALYFVKIPTITAKMEIRYRAKTVVGETLKCIAWMKRDRGKMVEAEAEILNLKGEVVADAIGLFHKVDEVERR